MNMTEINQDAIENKPSKQTGSKYSLLFFFILRFSFIFVTSFILISLLLLLQNKYFPQITFLNNKIFYIMLTSFAAAVSAYFIFKNFCDCPLNIQKNEMGARLKAAEKDLDDFQTKISLEIAERQRVEKALSESEAQLRTVIREAPSGIALLDKEGRIIDSNPALQRLLDYSDHELIGVYFTQIIHPDDKQLNKKYLTELIEGKIDIYRQESRFIHKQFKDLWVYLSASIVRDPDGEPHFIIALIEDITDRRLNEERFQTYQKKLQSLTMELSLAEERERHRLATNLHDHIGQILSLISMKIDRLPTLISGQDFESLLTEIKTQIAQTIKYTRDLMFEISPPLLYDLGFEETVEWLTEKFSQQYGIHIDIVRDDQPKPLNIEFSFLLYQAVRELFLNIVKHSGASQARVSIERACNDLKVVVEDNGDGFDTGLLETHLGRGKGFGLFSIRERLEYFGGSLEIRSIPKEGTRVTLLLPMVQSKEKWTAYGRKFVSQPHLV